MEKVVIIAPCHPCLLEGLKHMNYDVIYQPQLSVEELYELLPSLTGMVISTRIPIDQGIIGKAKNLRWIGRLGSGVDHVDVELARRRQISILTSPEGNAPSVAEHALGMLLSAIRHIHTSHEEIKKHIWDRVTNKGSLLRSCKVGIIGYGHMGKAFAHLLRLLHVDVMIHDIKDSVTKNEPFPSKSLHEIQRECNVISLHINLTQENYHFANEAFFDGLERCPIFINTSRGPCVKTSSLLEAIVQKKVSYACLDVLENEHIHALNDEEKQTFEKLVNHPQILCTPHIAGVTEESFFSLSNILLEKIQRLQPV